jgi:SAM-dependent methyltransferase
MMPTSSSNPTSGNDRFNPEAATWDSKPGHHKASASALTTILHHFPSLKTQKGANIHDGIDVLEIGCGTGLLSFMIAPHVRSLTAVDAAKSMIETFKIKLEKDPGVRNLLPVYALLQDPDDLRIRRDPIDDSSTEQHVLPPRRFDLVLSHLVLHHIPSLEEAIGTMFGCLKSGGSVALTDFEDFGPEARRFHPEAKMAGVERHGVYCPLFCSLSPARCILS